MTQLRNGMKLRKKNNSHEIIQNFVHGESILPIIQIYQIEF